MMRRLFAIVLATLLGTVPVLAQTADASSSGQQRPQNSSQNSSDGQDAYAQVGDGLPSPLLIGGIALGIAGIVILVASRKSTSP